MKRRPYRYRYAGHSTHRALRNMNNVLAKIGQPISVTGVRTATPQGEPLETVLVRGTDGTARFGDLLWGFVGEETQALVELLVRLGIHKERAEHLAFQTPRAWPDLGADWLVRFLPGNRLLVLCRRGQIEALAQDERAVGLLTLPKVVKVPDAAGV